jgi:WD40 repeat protein
MALYNTQKNIRYLRSFFVNCVMAVHAKEKINTSPGKDVYLWRIDSGTMQAINHDSVDEVASVSWSNDGVYLADSTDGSDTQLYDVVKNAIVCYICGQDGALALIGLDPLFSTNINLSINKVSMKCY